MNDYEDKKRCVNAVKDHIGILHTLHPEETVEALREVSTFATEQADAQAETNDRVGVPDRNRPIDEISSIDQPRSSPF